MNSRRAWSPSITESVRLSQRSGRTNVTLRPRFGPKHKSPRWADTLRTPPQLVSADSRMSAPRELDEPVGKRFAGLRPSRQRAWDVFDDRVVLLACDAALAQPTGTGTFRKRTQYADVQRKVVARNEV